MGDWPAQPEQWGLSAAVISSSHPLALGAQWKGIIGTGAPSTATAWPAANRAIFVPFRIPRIMVAYQMAVGCGNTAGGNFDVGIYDRSGTLIVASGTTARVADNEVIVDITNTTLGPGVYYMALAVDGTSNMLSLAPSSVSQVQAVGIRQATTAFTLPSTITFETSASAYAPLIATYLYP